ncbi:glycosyltransferase family 2 protein [Roseixanthobacter liquoris]|uniref:glycosyltransferase family 2 protein n=1 Tax=Roseixanthobacter liquoris TaxID=3119921 RepID=UPI00372C0A93
MTKFPELFEGKFDDDFSCAIDAIVASIDRGDPVEYGTISSIVKNFQSKGEFDKAEIILLKSFARNNKDIRIIIDTGSNFSLKKDYDSAIEWFSVAEKLNPRNSWPYFLKSKIYRKSGRSVDALNILSKGLNIAGNKIIRSEFNNMIKEYCDLKAIIAEGQGIVSREAISMPADCGREVKGALQVSLVKNEGDIIYANLSHSYFVGIRNFVIGNNASTDTTIDEINRFKIDYPNAVVFVVDDPVVGYHQAAKTTALARFGKTIFDGIGREIEWIFPLDGDEFLRFVPQAGDLLNFLSSDVVTGKKVIAYHWMHAFSSDIHDTIDPNCPLENYFFRFSGFGPTPVRKIAFRATFDAYLEIGNHYVDGVIDNPSDLVVAAEHGLVLGHYPVRSVSQIKSKIINGAMALIAGNISTQYGGHWRKEYERYLAIGDMHFHDMVKKYNDNHANI